MTSIMRAMNPPSFMNIQATLSQPGHAFGGLLAAPEPNHCRTVLPCKQLPACFSKYNLSSLSDYFSKLQNSTSFSKTHLILISFISK